MRILSFFILSIFYTSLFSHEYWINLDKYNPQKNEGLKVFIQGGHSFPKSSFAISSKVLHDTYLWHNNIKSKYTTNETKKQRTGTLKIQKSGIYLLSFIIKRSEFLPPQYYAKSIVNVGNSSKFSVKDYTIPDVLDIVPQEDLRNIKAGDKLSIQVLNKNKPIKATLNITSTSGDMFFIRTNKSSGIATFKIKKYGIYLITTSHKGIGSALTFKLNPPKGGK